MPTLILLVFAFVLFVIAGWQAPVPPAPSPWHYRLLAFGLACWVMAEILRPFFQGVR